VGGSIAWVDPGGALKVGPHSAGADPGPAGVRRRRHRADGDRSDVVLGYLDGKALLGGRFCGLIAPRRNARSIAPSGGPLGMSVPEAAARIIEGRQPATWRRALRIVSNRTRPRSTGVFPYSVRRCRPVQRIFIGR